MKKFRKGSSVKWKWSKGEARGKVKAWFQRRVSRKLNGSTIVRNGDADNPAYLVEQADGAQALKSHSELEKA